MFESDYYELQKRLTGLTQEDADEIVELLGFSDREKLYQAIKKIHLGDDTND